MLQTFHIKWNPVCGLLFLISRNIMFWGFTLAIVWIVSHFFSWLNSIPLYGCTAFCLSIPQLTDIWVVSTFWLYAQCYYEHSCISFYLNTCFQSFGDIPRVGIAGLYGNWVFNWRRNHQTFPQWLHHFMILLAKYDMRVLVSRNLHQHLLFFLFLTASLVGVQWCLTVVLIFIFI